jgi:1-acylglycerone phosphate reductase
MATVSEVLRLEMKPLGVKVVTVITGAIETNLFVNGPEHRLPDDSRYKAAEKEIALRATGRDVTQRSKCTDFARDLVKDILQGSSGKVYRGAMASSVHFASIYMPTSVLVRLDYLWL